MALTIGQTLSWKTILFILWDFCVIQRMATSQNYLMKKKNFFLANYENEKYNIAKDSLGRATSISRQKLRELAQIEKQSGTHSRRLKTNLSLRHLML